MVSANELPSLVEAALAVYPEAKMVEALRETVLYWNEQPSKRLLAMPAPGVARWKSLVEAIGLI